MDSDEMENRNYDKTKAHACLSIIAWMLIATTGALFARYYRFILPSVKIFGVDAWFNIHRALMIFVPIISFTSFMIILADLNWKWVRSDEPLEFAHSLFGILTLIYSFVQVIVPFFRPEQSSQNRIIFSLFHRIVGLTLLILSTITMFLGVFIDKMFLGSVGWGLMIGWTIWVLILPIALEVLSIINKRNTRNEVEEGEELKNKAPNQNNNIKLILLIIHLVIALAFSIALIVVIGVARKK